MRMVYSKAAPEGRVEKRLQENCHPVQVCNANPAEMVCLTLLPPSGHTGGYARHSLFHAVKVLLWWAAKKVISLLYAL